MIFAISKSLRWGYLELAYMPISELITFYNLVAEQWERERAEIDKLEAKRGM